MDQRIVDLYDEYTHAPLERRVFLARLAALTGSMAAALSWVRVLEADPANVGRVAADDERLAGGRTTFAGASGKIAAYLVRTPGDAKLPAVIVIHENRGLNAHIEDVARRLALEGFLALAPDLLSRLGGTPEDPDAARELIGKLSPEDAAKDLLAAMAFLEKHPGGTGRVGAVGFCWGGGMVGELAVLSAGLDAGVVYYGRPPAADSVGAIRAPLLLHYAGLDTRINESVPAFEAALTKAKKPYEKFVYEGVQHAFHNDTSEARFNQEAAELSWTRTVAFLNMHLKA